MWHTGSEAASTYSASEMEISSMYTQSNHNYQPYFTGEMDEAMSHSQLSQPQILQGETSEVSNLSRKRCCRPQMSEAEKKENKRQIDKRHREKKKTEQNERIHENENLKLENENLKLEICRLNRVNEENKRENERLTLENIHLQSSYSGLLGNEQLPEQVPPMHSNVFEQLDDGLEMNDLLAFPTEQGLIANGRVSLTESALEEVESLHHCQIALTEFLEKLEAEVESNVGLSDFPGLEAEQSKVGRYNLPLCLIPTVEKIKEVHGDVSANVLINRSIAEAAYAVFCAAIKEMDDLQLEEVTEDRMLKWRDAINDASRLNFKVIFAMEHLKKIARAYFGLPAAQQLQDINANISNLECKLNDEKRKHAKIYEDSKSLIAATLEFSGMPVSTGLFSRDPT